VFYPHYQNVLCIIWISKQKNGCLVEEMEHTAIYKDKIELVLVSKAVLRSRGNDLKKELGMRNKKF
jgi:hypothetical protein